MIPINFQLMPGVYAHILGLPASCSINEFDEYWSVVCDERPDFWFGTFFVLKDAPFEFSIETWRNIWLKKHNYLFKHEKALIIWEKPLGLGKMCFPLAAAFDESIDTVLKFQNTQPAITEKYNISAVTDPLHWDIVLRLLIDELVDDVTSKSFLKWRINTWRQLVEIGRGGWWIAFENDQPLATAGMFWDNNLSAVDEVVTASTSRRKGIATFLLKNIITTHIQTKSSQEIVVIAETDSIAEKLYLDLGFIPINYQYTWMLDVANI